MAYWAPLLLLAITGVLLVLPVTPALQELRKRQDAGPLPTSRHDGRIRNFAESFQARLQPLRPELEKCAATKQQVRLRQDGLEVLLVGRESFSFDPEEMQHIQAVMCHHTACVPSGRVINADVWSFGDLDIAQGAVLRAGMAFGDIRLKRNGAALRWLHARGSVYLGEGSTAHNRLSADEAIVLESGCRFERAHAPIIVTTENGELSAEFITAANSVSASMGQESDPMEFFTARPRMRVQGDFVLPPGESLRANVITTGEFRVGRGASFFGSVKSYKDTVIEEGASVQGSIACGGTAYVGNDAVLSGPLMAEDDVQMSSGSCVGSPGRLTTLAACRVRLSPGCRVCGTIWARVQGIVET
jgi:predicted acyltransferase (DUF342 family)